MPDKKVDSQEYAYYLADSPTKGWRKFVDVQMPYRWHIRSLKLGFVLDIGCGVGRNLAHLNGNGIGIDINPYCIKIAREVQSIWSKI